MTIENKSTFKMADILLSMQQNGIDLNSYTKTGLLNEIEQKYKLKFTGETLRLHAINMGIKFKRLNCKKQNDEFKDIVYNCIDECTANKVQANFIMIAEKLGLTRERVRQIYKNVFGGDYDHLQQIQKDKFIQTHLSNLTDPRDIKNKVLSIWYFRHLEYFSEKMNLPMLHCYSTDECINILLKKHTSLSNFTINDIYNIIVKNITFNITPSKLGHVLNKMKVPYKTKSVKMGSIVSEFIKDFDNGFDIKNISMRDIHNLLILKHDCYFSVLPFYFHLKSAGRVDILDLLKTKKSTIS